MTAKYKICSGHRHCLVFFLTDLSPTTSPGGQHYYYPQFTEEEAVTGRGRNLLSFTLRKQQQSQDSKVWRLARSQPLGYSTWPLNKHAEAGNLRERMGGGDGGVPCLEHPR